MHQVVIRVNPKPDSALVGRCFVRDQLLIVAAPSFPAPPPLTMMRDAVLTGIAAAKLPRLLVADDLAAGPLV